MIETTGSGDRRREAGSDAWSAAARSGTSAARSCWARRSRRGAVDEPSQTAAHRV